MFGGAALEPLVLREFPQNERCQNATPPKSFSDSREHKGAAVVDVYDGPTRRTLTLGPWVPSKPSKSTNACSRDSALKNPR